MSMLIKFEYHQQSIHGWGTKRADPSKSGYILYYHNYFSSKNAGGEQIVTCLVNKVNCRLKIKAKINKFPFNAFTLVLLLLQDEHGVIEELLKFLICVVDAKLLKRIQLGKKRHIRNRVIIIPFKMKKKLL
jgi:hypothetical protein